MDHQPRVTVIMPVYNEAAFLRSAVESILNQRFTDFELLIVDDGSNDVVTLNILNSLNDDRIRILKNEENLGITRSLKRGVISATGEFIARMDADDIAFPTRMEKQVAFLDTHLDTGFIGSACYYISYDGQILKKKVMPELDLHIRWVSLFENPIIHPSSMYRRSLLQEHCANYNEAYPVAQDFDLWQRLLPYTKAANLKEPLLYYRMQKQSTSFMKREKQLSTHLNIAGRTLEKQPFQGKISREAFNDLVPLVAGFDWQKSSNIGKNDLIQLYLDMWLLFKELYPDNQELKLVQHNVIIKAALMAFRSPERTGFIKILRRFSQMNPVWPFELLLEVPTILQTISVRSYRKSEALHK